MFQHVQTDNNYSRQHSYSMNVQHRAHLSKHLRNEVQYLMFNINTMSSIAPNHLNRKEQTFVGTKDGKWKLAYE